MFLNVLYLSCGDTDHSASLRHTGPDLRPRRHTESYVVPIDCFANSIHSRPLLFLVDDQKPQVALPETEALLMSSASQTGILPLLDTPSTSYDRWIDDVTGNYYNTALRIHIQAQVFLGAQTLRSLDVGVARRSSVVVGKNCT